MRIVDVDIKELQQRKAERRRSADVQALIDAIQSLKRNQAKAVVLGRGETAARMRSRLHYAARIAGRRLQIVVDGHEVVFGLATGQRRTRRSSRTR